MEELPEEAGRKAQSCKDFTAHSVRVCVSGVSVVVSVIRCSFCTRCSVNKGEIGRSSMVRNSTAVVFSHECGGVARRLRWSLNATAVKKRRHCGGKTTIFCQCKQWMNVKECRIVRKARTMCGALLGHKRCGLRIVNDTTAICVSGECHG
jgi:hypothetical protein